MLILNYHCFSSCYSNLDLYIYKWVNPFIRWNSKYNLVLHFMLGFFIKSVYWVSKQNQKSTRCDLDILSKSLSMLFDAQKCSMICNITKSCSLSHCTLSIIKIFFAIYLVFALMILTYLFTLIPQSYLSKVSSFASFRKTISLFSYLHLRVCWEIYNDRYFSRLKKFLSCRLKHSEYLRTMM